MGYRSKVANGSGAALGYIYGNLPGAFAGYYAGKRLEKLTRKKMSRKRISPHKFYSKVSDIFGR